MGWITPKEAGPAYDGRLPDDDKIEVELKAVEVVPDEKFGSGPRAQLTWVTTDPQFLGLEIRDWSSIKLGKMQNGTPSKLRQLCNAIKGRPFDAEVGGVDDETLEFSTDGGALDGQIKPGVRVVVIGTNREKVVDGERRVYYGVERYRAVQAATASPRANGKPTGRPVAAAVAAAKGREADFPASDAAGF